jgi:hypothetical protein
MVPQLFMLVPLGADGCLVFVGCDLNLTGGGTTVRIVLHFSIVYFFSLALLWGGQRYPPSAALECYDLFLVESKIQDLQLTFVHQFQNTIWAFLILPIS